MLAPQTCYDQIAELRNKLQIAEAENEKLRDEIKLLSAAIVQQASAQIDNLMILIADAERRIGKYFVQRGDMTGDYIVQRLRTISNVEATIKEALERELPPVR